MFEPLQQEEAIGAIGNIDPDGIGYASHACDGSSPDPEAMEGFKF